MGDLNYPLVSDLKREIWCVGGEGGARVGQARMG